MIHALWIIPIVFFAFMTGFILAAILAAGKQADDVHEQDFNNRTVTKY